jgi:hypothetical protein
MAEDNRLDQIKEGAGLEDSRVNQEFVDFIRKWSTPVLLVAALLALGYFLYNKRIDSRAALINEAFIQLNQSTSSTSPSPDALRRIAQDYKSVEGVYIQATMAAADEYLRAVQRGIKPGSAVNIQTNELESADDLLTEDDRVRFLSEAESMYKEVHAATVENPRYGLHTLGALYGLAAVSESRGDLESARNVLEQAAALAQDHGFLEQSAISNSRIQALPTLGESVQLVSKADLPEIPALRPIIPEILDDLLNPGDDTVGPQLPEGDAGEGGDETDEPADDGTAEEEDPANDDETPDDDGPADDSGEGEDSGEAEDGETSDDGGL